MQRSWQTPHNLLVLMSIAMPIAFSAWAALLNNFVVEQAGFTGVEIGILQSLREVPGLPSSASASHWRGFSHPRLGSI